MNYISSVVHSVFEFITVNKEPNSANSISKYIAEFDYIVLYKVNIFSCFIIFIISFSNNILWIESFFVNSFFFTIFKAIYFPSLL